MTMDPQACFQRFVDAVADGNFDIMFEAASDYRDWIAKGGFKAKDADGSEVVRLDAAQDRYLVLFNVGQEVWRYPPT